MAMVAHEYLAGRIYSCVSAYQDPQQCLHIKKKLSGVTFIATTGMSDRIEEKYNDRLQNTGIPHFLILGITGVLDKARSTISIYFDNTMVLLLGMSLGSFEAAEKVNALLAS
jgi:hypothetical protein